MKIIYKSLSVKKKMRKDYNFFSQKDADKAKDLSLKSLSPEEFEDKLKDLGINYEINCGIFRVTIPESEN